MLFSICMIAKNEEKTLPRFINSPKTKEFLSKGGEICLLDTGSADNTVAVARAAGFKVKEVHTKHIHHLSDKDVNAINKFFIVEEDLLVVKKGQKYFNFSDARNEAASMASNDIVSFVDCDEEFTVLDFDKINKFIEEGFEQFEYKFVYAHDNFGKEAISFTQSKMYNRRKAKWVNYVHEVLSGNAKIKHLDESIFKLEHFQAPSDHRSNYLPGLAIDCYKHLTYDRNSHYFAREMMYNGRYKSAIKEFKRHISLKGWSLEAAQSMIFIGDCYGFLDMPDLQAEWYSKSFHFNSERREALLKLAAFYKHNNNFKATAAYATAAMEIPYVSYYANNMSYYTNYPHELLYWAYGWMGNIAKAQEHITEALRFQPHNPNYLRDTKFYFEYPDNGIDGWMMFEECQALYNIGKKYTDICEVGSWKGRSTHAFLTGCKGSVTAVDTWMGSKDPLDQTYELAKKSDIFEEFKKNVGHFKNLVIKQGKSVEVAKTILDRSFDIVFIDAGHTYEEVKEDIKAWKNKARIALCGHDYNWPGVSSAVNDILGKPDEIAGTIWYFDLEKNCVPDTSLSDFIKNINQGKNFSFIKRGDGEMACMQGDVGCNCDGHPYSAELAYDLKRSYEFLEDKSIIVDFYNQKDYNVLLHRTDSDLKEVSNFYKSIINSPRDKYFIGPERLKEIASILKAKHIIIPLQNAYSHYKEIMLNIPETKNAIYLFSAGMSAKVMIADLIKRNTNATYLDCGSAFDPIVGITRTFQISEDVFRNLYKQYKDNLPTVSIIIPTLGREEGLQKCLNSIKTLNYSQNKLEIIVIEDKPRLGVPKRLDEGYRKSTGDYIVYAANDMEFTPNSLVIAIKHSQMYNKGLVAFNTGPTKDNYGNPVCEHFIIARSLVEELGEIFDTEFSHVGVDNLLWAKCDKLNQTSQCLDAVVIHNHFSHVGTGGKGTIGVYDEVHRIGWKDVEKDRKLLKLKMAEIKEEIIS